MTNHPFKIRPIANRDKAYLAYFKCDFLKATFCVAFQDTIFGALGLNRFSEMIKTSFSTSQVKISVSSENLKIKSQALIDELIHIEREEI
ncbi:MAG: hypothetical protein JXR70_13105 [Spirochaetales bacterium]|nr:hypothetical protein [Spirochaetales bacterium]